MSYIYLASPYSHEFPIVREKRFLDVCEAAGHLMKRGYHIFSPIAHCHPIAKLCDLPKGFDYWNEYDYVLLAGAKELWVLTLEGWEKSTGIQGEVQIADEYGKPVRFFGKEEIMNNIFEETLLCSTNLKTE